VASLSSEFPNKVFIGNRKFTIQQVSDGSMGDDLGEVLFTLGKINVLSQQSRDCLVDTILHEIVHAIDFVYGAAGHHLTEEQVVRVTGGLLTVLTDPRNVQLMKFLLVSKRKRE